MLSVLFSLFAPFGQPGTPTSSRYLVGKLISLRHRGRTRSPRGDGSAGLVLRADLLGEDAQLLLVLLVVRIQRGEVAHHRRARVFVAAELLEPARGDDEAERGLLVLALGQRHLQPVLLRLRRGKLAEVHVDRPDRVARRGLDEQPRLFLLHAATGQQRHNSSINQSID